MIDRLDLHAYADGELSPEERARIERLIADSPDAAREVEAIRNLKSCLQTKLEPQSNPTLWKECLGRLDELDKVKKAEFFVGKYAWALCLVLFLVIMGGGLMNRLRGSIGMGTVASYSSDMIPIRTPQMQQPEQLRSWVFDQTQQRPAVQPDPARVVGMWYLDRPEGGRVVQLRMADSLGLVDVMIIPNVTRIDGVQPIGGNMFAGQMNGFNCVTWPDSGCACIAIGNRDYEQLRAFAQSLYRIR